MLNQCTFLGRLTADPNVRQVGDSTLAKFTIAVDRDRPNRDGEREADYIDCTAWNQVANFLSKYFAKGDAVVVVGRLKTSTWKDDSGANRKGSEINVENIYFVESSSARKARAKKASEPEEDLPSEE